jgi:release factor glutamine methyltransferase
VPRLSLHIDPSPPGADALARYEALLVRRERREPVAYLLRRAEFYSREFLVTPAVLVPRPETEHLVEAALALLPSDRPALVVDVGTGSGCIAVTLAAELPRIRVLAVDRSAGALSVARENARRHGVADRVPLLRADLLEAVRGPVDLVVSNPPYVGAGDDVDPEVRHEPPEALFAGPDGLDAYRRIAPAAARVLRPGGTLLLETPGAQVAEIHGLCRKAGLEPDQPIRDLAGAERVVRCRRPGALHPG